MKHIIIGIWLLVLFIWGMIFEQNINFHLIKARQAIAECEKSLPRDQECQVIILANPKENK